VRLLTKMNGPLEIFRFAGLEDDRGNWLAFFPAFSFQATKYPVVFVMESAAACVADADSSFLCFAEPAAQASYPTRINRVLPTMTGGGGGGPESASSASAGMLAALDDLVDAYVTTLYTCIVLVYLLLQYRIKIKLQRRQRQAEEERGAADNKIGKAARHDETIQVSVVAPDQASSAAAVKKMDDDEDDEDGGVKDIGDFNLTGTYKMISNENMDAFLTVQGVPWALRRAAAGVMPHHHITHFGHQLTIRIHAANLLETTTSYTIHGPTVETIVRGRLFRDKVTYHIDPMTHKVNGIQTKKTAVTEGYVVTVLRVLSDDRNTINMTSAATFPNDPTKPDVVSKQVFQRISNTTC
jgi:hypothetical protein